MTNFNNADFLIIANGLANNLATIQALSSNRITMALDGAADFLSDNQLFPDIILGDFDSINNIKNYQKNNAIKILPAPNQNFTDLDKAIQTCDSYHAKSITILHATGGRIDHELGNIGLLRKYYCPQRPICVYTPIEKIQCYRDTQITLTGQIGSPVSLLGFTTGAITTSGLRYDVQQLPLEFGIKASLCNEFAESTAIITITGTILIIQQSTPHLMI